MGDPHKSWDNSQFGESAIMTLFSFGKGSKRRNALLKLIEIEGIGIEATNFHRFDNQLSELLDFQGSFIHLGLMSSHVIKHRATLQTPLIKTLLFSTVQIIESIHFHQVLLH